MRKQEDETLDLEGLIKELEQKLERLKIVYEQYFMGIEKREPLVLRKDVVRIMRALDLIQIRNTGLRFRHRMIIQRFNSYRTYWSRTLRAIEQGTYHRDVARVSRKMTRQGFSMPSLSKMRSAGEVERAISQALHQAQSETDAEEQQPESAKYAADPESPAALQTSASLTVNSIRHTQHDPSDHSNHPEPESPALINIDHLETPSVTTGRPAMAGMKSPPRPVSTSPSRTTASPSPRPTPPQPRSSARPFPSTDPLSDEQMQSLYRRFIKAKKMCGEDTKSVHYETLAKSLSQQLPKIQAQHQGKRVEFQVVIRAGRAIIRAQGKE